MVQHIIEIAEAAKALAVAGKHLMPESKRKLQVIAEELSGLELKDFLPAARPEFLMIKKDLQILIAGGCMAERELIGGLLEKAIAVLNKYGGGGSGAVSREFPFIADSGLRTIVERDYRELTLQLFPSGAWKSTVVMAGSILEAILFDQLTQNAGILKRAMTSKSAPKYKGKVKDIIEAEWKFQDLIRVASDLGVLPEANEKTIDQTLRDYRNFIHARKEKRAGHPCREAQALMAKGALDGVCDLLAERGK